MGLPGTFALGQGLIAVAPISAQCGRLTTAVEPLTLSRCCHQPGLSVSHHSRYPPFMVWRSKCGTRSEVLLLCQNESSRTFFMSGEEKTRNPPIQKGQHIREDLPASS